MPQILLEITDFRKYFEIRGGLLQRVTGYVRAVDNVSLQIEKAET